VPAPGARTGGQQGRQGNDLLSLAVELREEVEGLRSMRKCERESD